MTPLRFHAGPAAAGQVLSDLQAADGQPVAWTRQPVVEATRRAICEQVAARASAAPEILVLLSAGLDPLARVLPALPGPLRGLLLRPEFVTDVVYWPAVLKEGNDLPVPGEPLTTQLWTGSLRAEFARMPQADYIQEDHAVTLPALAPKARGPSFVRDAIARLALPSGTEGTALRAGLFQLQDELDDSHECSQSIEGLGRHRNGDYWHAIMHRREPDELNSAYWFRRVKDHPVFYELAGLPRAFACDPVLEHRPDQLMPSSGWNPEAFIDVCLAARQCGEPRLKHYAEKLQWAEMLLLLEHTARDAGLTR